MTIFLHFHAITHVPPGITHDEADHGLDAWGVVNGIRPIYFTVGYGREPFFDYTTAILLSFLGPTFLGGRLNAIFWHIVSIAGIFAWTHRVFDKRVALLTLVGSGFSFWGIMTGRHALRSVTMPALFVLATLFYWFYLHTKQKRYVGFAGILLGITFYTYMPARILWGLFPCLLLFWGIFQQDKLRTYWKSTISMLGLAGIIAFPLFYYLHTHSEAEVRLSQLSGPLTEARHGNLAPLWQNIVGSLKIFTVEGDTLWRYNIPHKPLFEPVMGILFYVGILMALIYILCNLWRKQYSRRLDGLVFAMGWLLAGMIPALITGPEASVTRVIGMQPVLYLFPALALVQLDDWVTTRLPANWSKWTVLVPIVLFACTFYNTFTDYFIIWANAPEVRVQYETTLVTAMNYLNEEGKGVVAVSNPTPDQFHSPATALMTLRNESVDLRWFNGLSSFLLPQDEQSTVIFSGFAPLKPALEPYFLSASTPTILPLRPTDIDHPLTIYEVNATVHLQQWQAQFTLLDGQFANVVQLQGVDIQNPVVKAGEPVQIVTWWHIQQSQPDLVLFTHLPNPAGGEPLAQADRLDAPSVHWQAGDYFLQLHTLQLPASLPAGRYPLIAGIYHKETGQRLPVMVDGQTSGDVFPLPMIEVIE